MKKLTGKFELVGILSLALVCFGLNFFPIAAQETGRERVIVKPTPTVTPKQTPTPQPTVTPTATPVPVQSISELQSRIRLSLSRSELRRGSVGVKIISLDTGKIIFEENAEKYFMPASNMKSYTVAAAIDKLSPNFRFVTSVYANSAPDASGVIHGDLTIYGRGDPSFSMAFTQNNLSAPVVNSDYLKSLDALANKIVQAGVKRIEGNLIGDETYFNSEPIPPTWEWDDLQWYYGAEISSLSINDNALDLSIKPSAIGSPAIITLLPSTSLMSVINHTITAPSGTKREIEVKKLLGANVLEITGKIPANDRGFTGSIAVSRPALFFVTLLRQLLEQKGVVITGATKAVNLREKNGVALNTSGLTEIAKIESPPFSVIAAKTMKPSQNLYTELILRALGEQVGDKSNPKKTSEARGLEVIQRFLTEAGIAPESVLQYDASGLSRHNLITPASATQLYRFMSGRPYAQSWRDSLTIGAVDGTLRNRFRGSLAANNVRGKTGTIDQVSALSGYITTASGEKLVFSILTNGIPEGSLRTMTIDEIVVALANFNGRTN